MSKTPVWIAALEGGGTSFVVAVAELSTNEKENIQILHRAEIDSSHDDPSRTLTECSSFFKSHKPPQGYSALGVAMFGPLGCDPSRTEDYGRILSTTPKKSWRGVDVLSPLVEACTTPGKELATKIDTDVNAPAVAEYLQETNISSLAYVTTGTGVGVGLVINGKPVHGKMHPEGGHIPIQPLEGDTFQGYSWGAKNPFKGKHTVESMTSSIALTERLEAMNHQETVSDTRLDRACLADLSDDDHEIWNHAANALANLCVTLALVTSVEKIVLGGGIMKRKGLIEKVRVQTKHLLNGYLGDMSETEWSEWITTSRFGSSAGLLGACVLAQQALSEPAEVSVRKAKQTAYGAGVWHGVILGLSAAYIGICFWARSGKTSSRR